MCNVVVVLNIFYGIISLKIGVYGKFLLTSLLEYQEYPPNVLLYGRFLKP